MARTISEIQQEIISYKEQQTELQLLDNTSKASIWRLWSYITAAAIWTHEKIVEKNTAVSRPHTLSWYREQALNFVYGQSLEWKDGFYSFRNATETTDKIIKHCAVGEVDLETIFSDGQRPTTSEEIDQAVARYFHNQVGIIFMKVANESDDGKIQRISGDQLTAFKEFMRQIKDAGNQIEIISIDGDQLRITLDIYVDPLLFYINPQDVQQADRDTSDPAHEFDPDNGVLINNPTIKPVEQAIYAHLRNLEFNGGLVKTFLIDAVQKVEGVKIPILRSLETGGAGTENLQEIAPTTEFFIPQSGYFDIDKVSFDIRYIPYTFYREYTRV